MDTNLSIVFGVILVVLVFVAVKGCKSHETFLPRGYASMSSLPSFIPAHHNPKRPSLKESFTPGQNYVPPFQVKNRTYWPKYFYSFPYNEDTYAWPPGLFSRSYYWYPGFSSGTGLSFHRRPSRKELPRPRNAWLLNSGGPNPHFNVSNRGEYQFNESNYAGI